MQIHASVKYDLKLWDSGEEDFDAWALDEMNNNHMTYLRYPNPHYSVPVNVGDQRAIVDEGISYLVYAMWKAGIRTISSCQGGPRQMPLPADLTREEVAAWKREEADPDNQRAGLGFPDTESVRKFVEIITDQLFEPGDLSDLVTGGYLRWDPVAEKPNYDTAKIWRWMMKPPQRAKGTLHTSLFADFPPGDIPELIKRVKKYG